jgi:hypothetical protein
MTGVCVKVTDALAKRDDVRVMGVETINDVWKSDRSAGDPTRVMSVERINKVRKSDSSASNNVCSAWKSM